MRLEYTDEEMQILDGGLSHQQNHYEGLAGIVSRSPRAGELTDLRDKYARLAELAGGLRLKLLVEKYGEKTAAQIVAMREHEPTLEELHEEWQAAKVQPMGARA